MPGNFCASCPLVMWNGAVRMLFAAFEFWGIGNGNRSDIVDACFLNCDKIYDRIQAIVMVNLPSGNGSLSVGWEKGEKTRERYVNLTYLNLYG